MWRNWRNVDGRSAKAQWINGKPLIGFDPAADYASIIILWTVRLHTKYIYYSSRTFTAVLRPISKQTRKSVLIENGLNRLALLYACIRIRGQKKRFQKEWNCRGFLNKKNCQFAKFSARRLARIVSQTRILILITFKLLFFIMSYLKSRK